MTCRSDPTPPQLSVAVPLRPVTHRHPFYPTTTTTDMYIHYTRSNAYAKTMRLYGAYRGAELISNPVHWVTMGEGECGAECHYVGAKDTEELMTCLRLSDVRKVCWDASEVRAILFATTGAVPDPRTFVDLSFFYRLLGLPCDTEPATVDELKERHLAIRDQMQNLNIWRYVWEECERINSRGVAVRTTPDCDKTPMDRQTCADGRLRGGFRIMSTKSGRATSSALYSLPKGGSLRRRITGTNGNPLICADWSSMEPRVMAYLLGVDWKLEAAKNGVDLYEELARRLSGVQDGSMTVTEERRTRAKELDIMCGYGAGTKTVAKKLGIPYDNAEFLVKRWHELHPGVTQAVEELSRLLRSNRAKSDGELALGSVTVRRSGDTLRVELPSGRCLIYRDSDNDNDRRATTVLQNIVSAFATDLLYFALMRCDCLQCVVMHQYDEIVLDTGLTNRAPDWLRMYLEVIMTSTPRWANGLPLKVKIKTVDRYE